MKRIFQMSKKALSQFPTQGNLFCLDDVQSVARFLRGLGLLFVLAGVFAFCLWLADFIRSAHDRQDSLLILVAILAFLGVALVRFEFSRYLTFDGRTLITRHRIFLVGWEEKQPLSTFPAIRINKRCDDRVVLFDVNLATPYMDTLLFSDTDYVQSRSRAEQLVRHFNVPLQDSSQGDTVEIRPEAIDQVVSVADISFPDVPENSRVRFVRDVHGFTLTLPAADRLPFTAVFRFIVLIAVGGFFIGKAMAIEGEFGRYFIWFFSAIVVLNFARDFYPFMFRPTIKVTRSGIWCKPRAFSRKVRCDFSDVEEVRTSGRRAVIIRSDRFHLVLPVWSHEQDQEFVRDLILWLLKETTASPLAAFTL
tara:strand:- start:238 stop:1329 length:1092 start_codon:yes stop_codon:yes gene_type:complete